MIPVPQRIRVFVFPILSFLLPGWAVCFGLEGGGASDVPFFNPAEWPRSEDGEVHVRAPADGSEDLLLRHVEEDRQGNITQGAVYRFNLEERRSEAVGACCNAEGQCRDGVPRGECEARFVPDMLCEDLNPPCRPITGPCIPDAPPFDGHPIFGNPDFAIGFDDTPGMIPMAITAADFDGDGDLDVATAYGDQYLSGVSVQFNGGDGVFISRSIYQIDFSPTSIVSADLNADDAVDIVTSHSGPGTVSVLLGAGDGTFSLHATYAAGEDTRSVVVGDVNGDKVPDLATCNAGSNDVRILLGRGDGTFEGGGAFPAGNVLGDEYAPGPFMDIGDLNDDGHQDLVVPISRAVSVLLGRGDGTFEPFVSYPTTRGASWGVVFEDFDGDRAADLAVINGDGGFEGDLSTFKGNGDGTFREEVIYELDFNPAGSDRRAVNLVAGDLDEDGDSDLVIAFNSSPGEWTLVLLNPGSGAFDDFDVYTTAELPNSVAIGHFNSDGYMDIAVSAAGKTCSLLGNGDGTFMGEQAIPQTFGLDDDIWHNTESITSGDFNGDGQVDLALANRSNNRSGPPNVAVVLNAGDGTFHEPVAYVLGPREVRMEVFVRTADLNGDESLDLAVLTSTDSTNGMAVLLNRGDGTFDKPIRHELDTRLVYLELSDLDGDRDVDVAAVGGVNNRVLVLSFNDGDGRLSRDVITPLEYGAETLAIGDLDGDGDADLAVLQVDSRHGGTRQLSLHFNNGDGTFPDPIIYPLLNFEMPWNVILADLDLDLDLDVAITNHRQVPRRGIEDHTFSLMFNDGAGGLGERIDYIVPETGESRDLDAKDMDDDGDLDLVIANSRNVTVILNDGNGYFSGGLAYGSCELPDDIVVDDLDGDGDWDIAAACSSSDNLTIIWNRGCRRQAGDLNGDGIVDLADYAFLYSCLTGPGGGIPDGCAAADLDRDIDVDLEDYTAFLPLWNRP
jgi:hypothetical protein